MEHHFDSLPGSLPAYLNLLARRRRYTGDALPPIVATAARATFEPTRLERYRALVGAKADGYLPLFAPQLLAAQLHLRLLADRAFPFPALGLVHLSNRIELLEAIPEGAPLSLRTWVAGVEAHRLGHALTLKTTVHRGGLDTAPLWRADTVALARRRGGAEASAAEGGSRPKPARVDLSDTVEVAVPESTGRAYARVAGDLNPIHQHAWLARPFGLPRAIVHGTWTAARAMAEFWPDAATEAGVFNVRFRAPVFLPARITLGREAGALVVADAESLREQVRIERSDRE
jgi:acyl dehydratase